MDFENLRRVPYSERGEFRLGAVDPDSKEGFEEAGRKRAEKKLAREHEILDELQRMLYAGGRRNLLVVLQAMDTAGKDGAIRGVFGPLNPQGVRVTGFKRPTAEEAAQHYLWRIRKELPARGMIGVFNRSHYEDILVPSVQKTVSPGKLAKRYGELRDFERELRDSGTTILKFYLHISKDEQKRRLQERLDVPEKNWKFDPGDLPVRALWDRYMGVYARILARTSTPWAPWFVIPSNRKWYRDIVIARIVRKTLEGLELRYPDPKPGLADIVIPD